jgi:hypothetical protein
MTYFERVDELRDGANFTPDNYELEYHTAEMVLVDLFSEYIKDAEIMSTTYGTGRVISTSGDTLDHMIMEVAFQAGNKKFGVLPVITGTVLFNKFADISEIGDAWDHAFDLHTDMTRKLEEFKSAERRAAMEAEKKAKAAKKAEEKYQQARVKAIKDFESMTQTEMPMSTVDEFYYCLGWLASKAGVFSAAMPDYLLQSFEAHFGTDYKPTIVDSKKKTINGNPMQWALSMKIALPKKVADFVPAYLTKYLSTSRTTIADTAFVWDLVDNYNFQFGKKQDIEKIRSCIPAQYLSFFEAGIA